MDKYARFAQFVKKEFTADFIANQITNVIDDVMNGNHPKDSPISIAWNVGDLLRVQGFYVVPEIVGELISCFMGRAHRLTAMNFGINPSTPATLRRMIPILKSTDYAEEAAIPIAIELMKQKIGVPHTVDEIGANRLIAKRDVALSYEEHQPF